MINLAFEFDPASDFADQMFEERSSAAALLHSPAISQPPRIARSIDESQSRAYRLSEGLTLIETSGSSASTTAEGFTVSPARAVARFDLVTAGQGNLGYTVSQDFLFHAGTFIGVNGGIVSTGSLSSGSGTTTIYAFSTAASGNAVTAQGTFAPIFPVEQPQAFASSDSELARRINAAREAATIDAESVGIADAATRDADYFVDRAGLGGEPLVMFADDGILTLQWQRGGYGVALLFAGDGEVSIAFKKPEQLYAQNGIDLKVSDDLPAAFGDALALVLG